MSDMKTGYGSNNSGSETRNTARLLSRVWGVFLDVVLQFAMARANSNIKRKTLTLGHGSVRKP